MSDFDSSPRTYARLAGFLCLFIIIAGIFAQLYVRDGMIVSGNAAATAEQLKAHATRWQVGIVAELLMHLRYPRNGYHLPVAAPGEQNRSL